MKPLTRLLATIIFAVLTLSGTAVDAADNKPAPSQAELEQLLAPIALYPDTVLSHILIAATYPLEVVQAERWVKANRDLTGEAALKAVESEDWDPSVKALVAFPQVVARMSEDLDWTQKLGDAFLADEEQVLASIQQLRQRAYAAGNLDALEHVQVERDAKTIVIEPAVREVVYIPYYDTRVVYGDWHWHAHPPVFWERSHYFSSRHYGQGSTHFYWSSGVRVQPRYVLSSFHWDRGHVVVVDIGRDFHAPYYWSSRHVIRHRDAHRWRHNPYHRRGAHYRHERLRQDYDHRHHSPRRDEPHWVNQPRRVPAGRYPHGTTRTHPRATAPDYPASSVTPRRYGRHPGVEVPRSSGTRTTVQQPPRHDSGNARHSPAGRLQHSPSSQQRAHPVRNSPRSGSNSSGNRTAPNTQRTEKPSSHLRSGGTVNRLIRTGP